MSPAFQYDAFLSYNSGDKAKVHTLANRLRDDGVDVWFDEWMIEPGDNIVLKMEAGVESSRVLILCMSEKAFGSGWVSLERTTALFRDPTNTLRRFVPLLLEDCQIPEMLRVLSRVDWRGEDVTEYAKLLRVLQRRPDSIEPSNRSPNFAAKAEFEGQKTRMILTTRPMPGLPSFVKLAAFPEPGPAERLLAIDGLLAVSNWGNQSVQFIDPEAMVLLRSVQMDAYEDRQAAAPQTGPLVRRYPPEAMATAKSKLFVSQVFSEFVCVIDGRSGVIVKRIPVGGEGCFATSPDHQQLYFASNREDQFYIIDTDSYEHTSVAFPPGGRGCLSCCALRNGQIYIGIQRAGKSHAGRAILAVFDTQRQNYLADIPLSDASSLDPSAAIALLPSADESLLYVAMFQSRKGIIVIDTKRHAVVGNISFEPNDNNKHFKWVDPLALAWYRHYLLSLNRNNYELVFIDPTTHAVKAHISLGGAGNGPRDIAIFGDRAIISHKELDGLLVVNLNEIQELGK